MNFSYFTTWPKYFESPGAKHTTIEDGVEYTAELIYDDDIRLPDEDFEVSQERLTAWRQNEWCFVGVKVTASFEKSKLASRALWGINSDAGEYLREVADELAEEMQNEVSASLKKLLDAVKAVCDDRNIGT